MHYHFLISLKSGIGNKIGAISQCQTIKPILAFSIRTSSSLLNSFDCFVGLYLLDVFFCFHLGELEYVAIGIASECF